METEEYYGGTYPEPPEEKEEDLDWDTYYEEQWEQHRLEESEEE